MLGQLIQFIINGYWNWLPEAYWLVAPLLIAGFEMILGLPLVLVLVRFQCTSWWAYCLAGTVVGIIPVELYAFAHVNDFLTFDWARITDDGTKPLTSSDVMHMYLFNLWSAGINPNLGLYGGLIGAAGGLAFWVSITRRKMVDRAEHFGSGT